MHELDNPVWSALTGPQVHLGTVRERSARFRPDVAPFGAFPEPPEEGDWADLAELAGSGGMVAVTGHVGTPPEGWWDVFELAGVQMVADRLSATGSGTAEAADEVLVLGDADVGEMLDLVELARPGPFLQRTIEFGGYLGIRRDGALVAMAGERLRPPGWVEVSAVATHPDHRGQGLAGALVRRVVARALSRGERPFLHASADNTGAIRLYRELGFSVRRETRFVVARAPGAAEGDGPGNGPETPG